MAITCSELGFSACHPPNPFPTPDAHSSSHPTCLHYQTSNLSTARETPLSQGELTSDHALSITYFLVTPATPRAQGTIPVIGPCSLQSSST